MNCPTCLIGGIEISHKDNKLFLKCSNRCFDTTTPDDYIVSKILLHNYLLKEAELEGRKAYLFSSEKSKDNPYTHEAYACAWDYGYTEEQSSVAHTAYKLATKQQEAEFDKQLPIVKVERANLQDNLLKIWSFLIEMSTTNYWRPSTYRKRIKAFMIKNHNSS